MFRRLLTVCVVAMSALIFMPASISSSRLADRPLLAPDVPSCLHPDNPPGEFWQLHTSMPTSRHHFATITFNGQASFYAIGGMLGWTDAVTAVERLNACDGTWNVEAALPMPRGYIQAAEVNGRGYIVGGVDHVISGTYGVQNTVLVYDPIVNQWSKAQSLPQALGGVAVAADNGKLYTFGGFDSRGPGVGDVNAVYEYDPNTDQWTSRPVLPGGARSLEGAAELNGEIYVLGGANDPLLMGLARNEVYDPVPQTWRIAQSIPDRHHSLTVVKSPAGFLYAAGGAEENYSYAYPMRYDPVADMWTTLYGPPEMNDYLYHAAAGVALTSGRLYVVGGVGTLHGETNSNTTESMWVHDTLCQSSLQAQPDRVVPNDFITYTAELRADTFDLNDVHWTIGVPDSTLFNQFVSRPPGVIYNPDTEAVEWHGSLSAYQAPLTVTFKVLVKPSGWAGRQLITNTMWILNGSDLLIQRSVGTWIDAFDLSTSTLQVNRGTAVIGDVLTYTIRVQNTSPQGGAATVIDPIPLNTSYVPGSVNSTLGTAHYGGGKIIWSGPLSLLSNVYHNASGDYQWGDSRGNGAVPGVKYDWVEIASTATTLQFASPHNAACYDRMFPFEFLFAGSVYTKTSVSTNGTMYFAKPNAPVSYMLPDNLPIPTYYSAAGLDIREFIAPLWDDLNLAPGHIFYQILGETPQRRVVIEFANVTRHASATSPGVPATFELVFFEGSNNILLQYQSTKFGNPLYDDGASATVGVQISPTNGLPYSYNTPSLSDGLAILYVPPNGSTSYDGAVTDITFAVQVDTALPGRTPITNTVTIASSTGQVITRETATLYGAPDFSASYLTSRQSIVKAGDSIDYDLHVINSGPVDGLLKLTDVVQHEPLLYYWSGSLDYPFGYGTDTNGIVEWAGLVPAMSSATIHFGAYVNFDPQGQPPISNTATLTNIATGAVLQRSVILDHPKLADLFVTSSGPGTIDSMAPFTYTIIYGNAGPFNGEYGPLITDILPPGVSVVSFSPGGRQNSSNTVVWDFSPLPAETTYALTVTVIPLELPLGDVLTNTVTISDMAQDPDWSNDLHQWFTRVGAVSNLLNGTAKHVKLETTGANPALAYTVLITNTGSLTATVTLTDPLPSGVIYQSGSSTIDDAPIELFNVALNQIEWTGALGPGAFAVVRFKVSVTPGHTILNIAQIDDGAGLSMTRSAEISIPWRLYLPLTRRD